MSGGALVCCDPGDVQFVSMHAKLDRPAEAGNGGAGVVWCFRCGTSCFSLPSSRRRCQFLRRHRRLRIRAALVIHAVGRPVWAHPDRVRVALPAVARTSWPIACSSPRPPRTPFRPRSSADRAATDGACAAHPRLPGRQAILGHAEHDAEDGVDDRPPAGAAGDAARSLPSFGPRSSASCELSIRLPGAIRFGCRADLARAVVVTPGLGLKSVISLFRRKPAPRTTTRLP